MILKNVHEYCEGYDVEFVTENNGNEVILAINEGGYNGVRIDAKELYLALKEIYENR